MHYDTDGRLVFDREEQGEEEEEDGGEDVMKSLSKSFQLFPALVSAGSGAGGAYIYFFDFIFVRARKLGESSKSSKRAKRRTVDRCSS